MNTKSAENSALDNEVLVNQSVANAELLASFRRAEADAAHKFGLIQVVAQKGPKAIRLPLKQLQRQQNAGIRMQNS